MNAVRVGLALRELRRRRRWRQADLARRSGTSQQSISRIERGEIRGMTFESVQRVLSELDADVDLVVRWRGGALDRLIDAGHAQLVVAVSARLATLRFEVLPEVSYSEYGERGSIDVLAVDVRARVLVVVEVKTEITSLEATLRKHDEKVRLAPKVASRRLGREGPWNVFRLLVLPESGAVRRRMVDLGGVLVRVYPLRGRELIGALRSRAAIPGSGGILLLPLTHATGVGSRPGPRHRVSRPGSSRAEHERAAASQRDPSESLPTPTG